MSSDTSISSNIPIDTNALELGFDTGVSSLDALDYQQQIPNTDSTLDEYLRFNAPGGDNGFVFEASNNQIEISE
jgi:hypothetical protein